MTDMSQWRCKHRELIFACRVIEDRFGRGAVDAVAAAHMKNVREAFARKAAETGRNDIAALAHEFSAPSDTHTKEVVRQDDRVFEVRITRCAHAEMFREWNAADVGLKFMCAGDEAMIAGFNPKIRLERPELLMQGDACCRFFYTLEA